VHPLQPGDLDFELFDQQIAIGQRRFGVLARRPFGLKFRALHGHETPQGFYIIRKRKSAHRHTERLTHHDQA